MKILKNLSNYWKRSSVYGKICLIEYFLKFPFFILHEVSHLILLMIYSKYFEIKNFKILEIEGDNVIVFNMEIESDGENSFSNAFIAIFPNIVYFILLFTSAYYIIIDTDIISVIIYIYILFGGDVAKSSEEDLKIYKKYVLTKYKQIVK